MTSQSKKAGVWSISLETWKASYVICTERKIAIWEIKVQHIQYSNYKLFIVILHGKNKKITIKL